MLKVLTGSSANPYIKNPRDREYYEIYDTWDEAKTKPLEYNVHKVSKGYQPLRFFIWHYIHHYINEKLDEPMLQEAPLETLVAIANGMIKSQFYNKTKPAKFWYHVAMVKAIEKYGYDEIPESVAEQINDLHDLKISYSEFKLEGDK